MSSEIQIPSTSTAVPRVTSKTPKSQTKEPRKRKTKREREMEEESREREQRRELQRQENRKKEESINNHRAITEDPEIQQHVFDFVKKRYESDRSYIGRILDPNCGRGGLFKLFVKNYEKDHCYFTGYNSYATWGEQYDDELSISYHTRSITPHLYLTMTHVDTYQTIICNPPRYISEFDYDELPEESICKKKNRLPIFEKEGKDYVYLDFVKKCFYNTRRDTELILIVPTEFLNSKKSAPFVKYMCEMGAFTHFFYPSNSSLDVVVIRHESGAQQDKYVEVNGQTKKIRIHCGVITFEDIKEDTEDDNNTYTPFSVSTIAIRDWFDVYTGISTGKDSVFRNGPNGNLQLMVGNDEFAWFTHITKFPSPCQETNDYLLEHKDELKARGGDYDSDDTWYKWKNMKNLTFMKENRGVDCIYLRIISRRDIIAFVDIVQPFHCAYLCLVPKNGSGLNYRKLQGIAKYFNSSDFRDKYTRNDEFRIGLNELKSHITPINIADVSNEIYHDDDDNDDNDDDNTSDSE